MMQASVEATEHAYARKLDADEFASRLGDGFSAIFFAYLFAERVRAEPSATGALRTRRVSTSGELAKRDCRPKPIAARVAQIWPR